MRHECSICFIDAGHGGQTACISCGVDILRESLYAYNANKGENQSACGGGRRTCGTKKAELEV